MKVCLIGTGYVGLVTGACLAHLGHEVSCVDIDAEKIAMLRRGRSPVYEPGIEELLERGTCAGRLSFTTDLEEAALPAEVIFIAVGTPPRADGSPDLSYVKAAAQGVGRTIFKSRGSGPYRIVVNKSTVPVGCGNWVEMLVREETRGLAVASVAAGNGHRPALQERGAGLQGRFTPDVLRTVAAGNGHTKAHPTGTRELSRDEAAEGFAVVSNPEFLREGTAIQDTLYPDRIVVGANDERALDALKRLYRPVLEQDFEPPACAPRPRGFHEVPLVATDLASAEMIKYAANAFLAMKISFANEIANICERTGADVARVMNGIGLDGRIGGRFLNAGVGWGGSCFGKDVSALIQTACEYGYRPALLEAAHEVNQRQRRLVIQKLQSALKLLKGRTVGLLGLAFKPDTDDVRDAPAYDIAAGLLQMGARVKVFDPVAMKSFRAAHPELDVVYTPNVQELAGDCDALVVVTEWPEFSRLDLKGLRQNTRGAVLIDGRNIFDPEEAREAGFEYTGMGR